VLFAKQDLQYILPNPALDVALAEPKRGATVLHRANSKEADRGRFTLLVLAPHHTRRHCQLLFVLQLQITRMPVRINTGGTAAHTEATGNDSPDVDQEVS